MTPEQIGRDLIAYVRAAVTSELDNATLPSDEWHPGPEIPESLPPGIERITDPQGCEDPLTRWLATLTG